MNLINLSIDILWLCLGIIILGAIIWVALWAVKQFFPVPAPVEKAIWAVAVILILIAVLSMFAGGGGSMRSFHWFGGHSSVDLPGPTNTASAAVSVPRVLRGGKVQ